MVWLQADATACLHLKHSVLFCTSGTECVPASSLSKQIQTCKSLLLQAVHEMPSGQALPMIAFVAQHLPSLATLPANSPAQAAFGEVLASCLASIRIEVVSAPTLAKAVAELLVDSLRPSLLPVLAHLSPTADTLAQHAQHAAGSTDGQRGSDVGTSELLLACLLRLYRAAVELHGRCAATQMQIEPLPGQTTGLSPEQSPSADHICEACKTPQMTMHAA